VPLKAPTGAATTQGNCRRGAANTPKLPRVQVQVCLCAPSAAAATATTAAAATTATTATPATTSNIQQQHAPLMAAPKPTWSSIKAKTSGNTKSIRKKKKKSLPLRTCAMA